MSNNLQDLKYLQTGSFNPVGVCEKNSKASDYLSSLDDAPQDHERHGRTKKGKKAEAQWVIFRNSQVGAS
jgi:hypothetical protein